MCKMDFFFSLVSACCFSYVKYNSKATLSNASFRFEHSFTKIALLFVEASNCLRAGQVGIGAKRKNGVFDFMKLFYLCKIHF